MTASFTALLETFTDYKQGAELGERGAAQEGEAPPPPGFWGFSKQIPLSARREAADVL